MNEISSKCSFPRSAGREMTLGEFLTTTMGVGEKGGIRDATASRLCVQFRSPRTGSCWFILSYDRHNFMNNLFLSDISV